MPSQKEKEIKEFLKAVQDGSFQLTRDTGKNDLKQEFRGIRQRADEDPKYDGALSTWLCRFKKKYFANDALQPPEDASVEEPDPPVPPATAFASQSPLDEPIAEADLPPPKTGPKRSYRNHHKSSPAPSLESETRPAPKNDQEQYAEDCYTLFGCTFDDSKTETTKKNSKRRASNSTAKSPSFVSPDRKRSVPATKNTPQKFPSDKSEPKSPISPEAEIMQALTLEEKAYEMIERQPVPPKFFEFTPGGNHGREMIKVPWADARGVMCTTFVIPDAIEARVENGGKEVHVTFASGEALATLQAMMEMAFAERLTNPNVRVAFGKFCTMLNHIIDTKSQRKTIVGVIPVHEFEAQESMVNSFVDGSLNEDGELVGGGVFSLGAGGKLGLTFSIKDKKKPRSQAATHKSPVRPQVIGSMHGQGGFPSPAGFPSPPRPPYHQPHQSPGYHMPEGYGQAYGNSFYQHAAVAGAPPPAAPAAAGYQTDPALVAMLQQLSLANNQLQQRVFQQEQRTAENSIVPSPRGGGPSGPPAAPVGGIQTGNGLPVSPLGGASVGGLTWHTAGLPVPQPPVPQPPVPQEDSETSPTRGGKRGRTT